MADCDCQCADGAPVGWRKIPGGGRGLPFGRPFGPGFGGGFGANNNNNNNNNNNSSNNNNMSALSNLLGLNGLNSMGGFGLGGMGFPFGGLPLGGFGPGFFPQGCCPGQDFCGPPGPCCCGPLPNGPPPSDCQPCGGVCWKKFKIVSPNGQECCFPVAVPWWCCDDGATGIAEPEGNAAAAEAVQQENPRREGCMSASQLLMQRYLFVERPEKIEIIDCPACDDDEPAMQSED